MSCYSAITNERFFVIGLNTYVVKSCACYGVPKRTVSNVLEMRNSGFGVRYRAVRRLRMPVIGLSRVIRAWK
jgi:hypothetical protein